jgi:predicted NodU family carbamoyl transferase
VAGARPTALEALFTHLGKSVAPSSITAASTPRTTHGGFGEKFYEEADLDSAETLSRDERADIAASIQAATEKAVIGMAGEGKNLCFAGGLGLNALVVEALEKSGKFENVWVQPAAGNAGTALGSALYAWHVSLGNKERKPLSNLFLGPEYDSGLRCWRTASPHRYLLTGQRNHRDRRAAPAR